MEHVKLQIGCLVVILYILVVYLKDTIGKRALKCNRLFDMLLVVSPWFIAFDGVTAWTINHQEIVPLWINLVFHELFYIFGVLGITFAFLYTLDATMGLPKKFKYMALLVGPAVISIVASLLTINLVYFVDGERTFYSMGIPVYWCYGALYVYLILMLILVTYHKSHISARGFKGILIFVCIALGTIIIQSVFPETLITSIMPTVLVLGLYLTLEDPSYRRLELHNEEMISGFATLVENRDDSTGGHIRRTKAYVGVILNEMKHLKPYREILTKDYVDNLLNAAPMHDIGKIATPDHILQKPGKLTTEEFETMKEHARIGSEIIIESFSNLDNPDYLEMAYLVARHHHEKWNGKGYPAGLSGESIPLCARIMAIADVFDAVSAKRCYRDPLPLEECFDIIKQGKGSDFDPALVDIFMNAKEEIVAIYSRYNPNTNN